jgi:hypothetical protein
LGFKALPYLGKTHILSSENVQWSNGPQLSIPKGFHSCSRLFGIKSLAAHKKSKKRPKY